MSKTKSKALATFNRLMLSNNNEPIEDAVITDSLLRIHLLYDRLLDGSLTDEQYILLNQLMVGTFYLAAQLNEHGSDQIREYTQRFRHDVEAAVLTISQIGCDKKERNSSAYVATKAELKVILFGVELYEFFMRRATQGHFVTATTKAAALITSKLISMNKRKPA